MDYMGDTAFRCVMLMKRREHRYLGDWKEKKKKEELSELSNRRNDHRGEVTREQRGDLQGLPSGGLKVELV